MILKKLFPLDVFLARNKIISQGVGYTGMRQRDTFRGVLNFGYTEPEKGSNGS